MSRIKEVKARQVLDSRGNPTVEATVFTRKSSASAIVPSGASTGKYEAFELRDHESSFHGKGVLNAVQNVEEVISPKIRWIKAAKIDKIDEAMIELDGTSNKSKLGANAILAVSMAAARAAAQDEEIPLYEFIKNFSNQEDYILPVPFMNIINGGVHAGNQLSVQEFMIAPIGAESFTEAVQMCSEIYHTLKIILKHVYGKDAINVGDEGGFAPPIKRTEDALKLLMSAIKETGYEEKVKIAMDVAASELYKDGKYDFDGKELSEDALVKKYVKLAKDFPAIISIEDPFDQEAFGAFAKLNAEIGKQIQIVGDDLLVTNIKRIQQAAENKSCNALLLKVNQIGTVTEAINAAKYSKGNSMGVMVSHRSGDSEDSFIADLAVGIGAGQIKSGAPCRAERTAKYNRLMMIEKELGDKAKYAGDFFRLPLALNIEKKE